MMPCHIRIWLTHHLSVPYLASQKAGLIWSFSRSRGPGGQHVNTTDTKTVLRFIPPDATWLPPSLQTEMAIKANVQVFSSDAHRSRSLNQVDCLQKLEGWLRNWGLKSASPLPPPLGQQLRVQRLRDEEKNRRRQEKDRKSRKKQERRIDWSS